MNSRAGPPGLPHSRAWSLTPPPPRISRVAVGIGGGIWSGAESRSMSYLPVSVFCMTGTLRSCDRGDIRVRTEHIPRRLLLEQDVIRGLKQDQVRVRNQCGEQPAFFDRDHSIVPRVHDQGARTYLRRELADVHAAARMVQPCRGLGRRRAPE